MRGNPDKTKPYRWKKGQPSPNPGGRPKKTAITEALRILLEKEMPNDPQGRTYAELVAEATIRQAIRGNVQAVREIADRTEGRARQAIELQITPLSKAFDRMTAQELDGYARTGALPEWFEEESGALPEPEIKSEGDG